MDTGSKPDSAVFALLQPELLTERELREILISRCVSRNLTNHSKEQLVSLFRNVALPLPQREYKGTSNREKRLAKKQEKTKRIITILTNSSSSLKSKPLEKTKRPSHDTSSTRERLKPPPDLAYCNKKVIKLSEASKSKSSGDLNNIHIKSKSKGEEVITPHTSEATQRTSHNVSPLQEEKKTSQLVILKRDSSCTKDDKSEDKTHETLGKKKRQKIVISW